MSSSKDSATPAGSARAGAPSPRSRMRSAAGARAASAQHAHLVGDDLGGVAVVAFLVLPLARADLAFDVDLRALAQVLRRDLGQAVEHDDVVPFRRFLVLARLLVAPLFRG